MLRCEPLSVQEKYQAGTGTYVCDGYIYASVTGLQQTSSSNDTQVRLQGRTAAGQSAWGCVAVRPASLLLVQRM
jgi:exosome complex RNA-binding protein Csl4